MFLSISVTDVMHCVLVGRCNMAPFSELPYPVIFKKFKTLV